MLFIYTIVLYNFIYLSLFCNQVCENDIVVVNVENDLAGGLGTTIHWHGILQHGSQHMDGVPMVTQCPIPHTTSFQYKYV